MWIAAVLLVAPWFVPTRGDVRVVAAGFAVLPLPASLAVVYAIIVARVRARRLWARSDLAGV